MSGPTTTPAAAPSGPSDVEKERVRDFFLALRDPYTTAGAADTVDPKLFVEGLLTAAGGDATKAGELLIEALQANNGNSSQTDLPANVQRVVKDLFQSGDAEQIARRMKEVDFQVLLLAELERSGADLSDAVGASFDDERVLSLISTFNPALAGLMRSMIGAGDAVPEAEARTELIAGYNAAMGGSLDTFHGVEPKEVIRGGQPVTVWPDRFPGINALDPTVRNGESQIDQFFGDGVRDWDEAHGRWSVDVETFQHFDPSSVSLPTGAPEVTPMPFSFRHTILAEWEKDEIVTFPNGPAGDVARAQFSALSQKLMTADYGRLNEDFVGDLERNGVITFANDDARDRFLEYTKGIYSGSDEAQITREIVEYIQDPVKGAGISFNAGTYDEASADLYDILQFYMHAEDGNEYASRIMAAGIPGVEFKTNGPDWEPPSARAGAAPSASPVGPGAGPSAAGVPSPPPPPSGPSAAGVPSPTSPPSGASAAGAASLEDIKAVQFDSEEVGYLDYGQNIQVNFDAATGEATAVSGTFNGSTDISGQTLFTFSDEDFDVYQLDVDAMSQASNNFSEPVIEQFDDQMSLAELGQRFPDGFSIQIVTYQDSDADIESSQFMGYYIQGVNADGVETSFYVGTEGIPEDQVEENFVSIRTEELESENNPHSKSNELGAKFNTSPTVDGNDPSQVLFRP